MTGQKYSTQSGCRAAAGVILYVYVGPGGTEAAVKTVDDYRTSGTEELNDALTLSLANINGGRFNRIGSSTEIERANFTVASAGKGEIERSNIDKVRYRSQSCNTAGMYTGCGANIKIPGGRIQHEVA